MYDLNLDRVAEWITARNSKRVALQLPEGLKYKAIEIASELEEKTGAEIFVVGDPCYGACDFPLGFRMYADSLVQLGHSEMRSIGTPEDVLFAEVHVDAEFISLIEQELHRLENRIGLITTVQHVHSLQEVALWLESRGRRVMIGKGDSRIAHPGQVLGCNVTAASSISSEVDQFIYIGSGNFHPLAVSLETGKRVLVVDPLNREVRDIEELTERTLRQRHGAIALASEANSFAVILCTKPGQMRLQLALDIKDRLETKGKDVVLVSMDRLEPEPLLSLTVDAYVSTACPRLAIDDYLRFKRPMLTPVEAEIVLGLREWEDYRFDSILGG